jgi:hypothetical protein
VLLLREAAPQSIVVLGTLPSGSAYPADPRDELARLVAGLKKVDDAAAHSTTAEASREAAYGATPSPSAVAKADKAVRVKGSGARKVTRCLLFELGPQPHGLSPEQIASMDLRGIPVPDGPDAARKFPPATAADDVWMFVRGWTQRALPEALLIRHLSRTWQDARRLHPAMVQNVWDVQRLVTGLLATPAFAQRARPSTPILPSQRVPSPRHHRPPPPHGPPRRGRGHGGHRPSRTGQTGAVEGAIGPLPSAQADASSAAASAPFVASWGRDPHAEPGSSRCNCAPRMRVLNPETCASTEALRPTDKAWPFRYPTRGRLAHWAVPCD